MIRLTDEDRDRLKDAVRSRRIEMGKRQEELARANGVSLTTWNLIELGKQDSYRELTLAAVFRALGWRGDALDFILRGEVPPAEDADSPPMRLGAPGEPRTGDAALKKVAEDMQEMLEAAYEEEGLRALEGDKSLATALGRVLLRFGHRGDNEDDLDLFTRTRLENLERRLTRLEERIDRRLAEPDDPEAP